MSDYEDYEGEISTFSKGPPASITYHVNLKSNKYKLNVDGWKLLPTGEFECQSLRARGEIDCLSLRSKSQNALNGSLMITRSAVLKKNIRPDDTEILVSDNSFSKDDILYMRYGEISKKGKRTVDKYEWLFVTDGPEYFWDEDTETVLWKYTVTRSYQEDNNYNYWPKGITLIVWVDADTGAILLAADRDYSPYIDILERTGTNIGDTGFRVRLGRLDGVSDDVLNPTGYGLYTDNAYLRGKLAIGGGYSDTAVEIYDSTGNRRGLISADGSGWFGGYDDFRWDDDGGVYIKNLELDNLILVGGGIDATGGVVTKIGLQQGLIISSDTRKSCGITRWDSTRFQVINGACEELLVFENRGSGLLRVKDWLVRNDSTVKDTLRVERFFETQKAQINKDLLVRDDATIKDYLYLENGIFAPSYGVTVHSLLTTTGAITGQSYIEAAGGAFEGFRCGGLQGVQNERVKMYYYDPTAGINSTTIMSIAGGIITAVERL